MSLEVTFRNPLVLPFGTWAALLHEELVEYGVPSPPEELDWFAWAQEVSAVPELAAAGIPEPFLTDGWQDWAVRVTQVIE